MKADADQWENAKCSLAIGETVACVVTHHCPFGILVILEQIPDVWGVIERIGMENDGYRTPEEYPPVGSELAATVVGFRDYSLQVELTMLKRMGGGDEQCSDKSSRSA